MEEGSKKCISCASLLRTRHQLKFCSNRCQFDLKYQTYISLWKNKELRSSTRNISRHLRRYLMEKYGEKCSSCKWSEKNPISGNIPLEVDHIDGNAQNNIESNLRLLCPNCHSLTPHFRNLNKGQGRSWRLKKTRA